MVSWNLIEEEDVGSTQAVAKGLASMDAPEGTTVVAKSQSMGKGRLGRTWASPVGGLYMSFILRPKHVARPELASLLGAVAVVQGVQRATGLITRIRWPNDVMAGSKKIAGVIAESQFTRDRLVHVIVGIGLNCNTLMEGSEPEATSLVEELGKSYEIAELKHAILESFGGLYSRWEAGEDLVPLWRAHVGTVGKEVSVKVKTRETPFSFEALEISPDGGLVVRDGDDTKTFYPEDIQWLRETK